MKIGQEQPDSTSRADPIWLLVLISFFGLGLFLGSRDILSQTWDILVSTKSLVRSVQPAEALPTLVVDMRFQNYSDLLQQREEAIQSGVYIPANRDYITATIRLDDLTVPVSIRLNPGPATDLAREDRWDLHVRTRQSQQLLGMRRFYLLSQADRDGLYQWTLTRALEREGLLASRYQFVNLLFNGDSWGTYALLEGFGDELMTANGRTAGVILEFDADLLWKSIAHFGSTQSTYADPVANLLATDFRYFEIDTFRDATIARDEDRSAQKDTSISRLRALQAGETPASEIFDVNQYGRFLALVDLWGAIEAVSLVNLRYYYNPDSDLLEPIGFGVGSPGGDERIPLIATYDDPILQAAYVREAQRLSQPAYLAELRTELEPEMIELQRALQTSGNEPTLPWNMIEERQEQIRRSLSPVQPVFAYLGPSTMSMSATIQIDLANVINLPVEVLGFDIGGLTFLEADPTWLQTEETNGLLTLQDGRVILNTASTPVIRYVRFHIPIIEIIRRDTEIDFMQALEIRVATRILGLDTHQLTLAREEALDLLIRP